MVTGAGSGIGRAVALALAGAGAEVILLGRTVRKLEAVHAEIEKLGAPEASIVPLDLERALAADYDAVAAAVEKRYGRLDGLLHNAALLGTLTPIEQYDVPTFMRVMHVNLTAAFVLTRQLLPLLRARAMPRFCLLPAASATADAPTGARIRFPSSRSRVSRRCSPRSWKALRRCAST